MAEAEQGRPQVAARLGSVLLVVNPTANSGRARALESRAFAALSACDTTRSVEVRRTRAAGDGTAIARSAATFDTVVALGGDGIAHEIVGGLMDLDAAARPAFALIPCGSGNDFARTLGMALDPEQALGQLNNMSERTFDIGTCNGERFCETLSFGMDAAIALDTVERRVRTGKTGTPLYMASGFDQMLHHRTPRMVALSVDGSAPERRCVLLFAVQIGRTYGGGFAICPDADPTDGLLDLCWAKAPVGLARTAFVFLSAKDGHHVSDPYITLRRARRVVLEFDEEPPAQVDGERIRGTRFEIGIEPAALRVLCAGPARG